ncbi:MAG: ABC-2 family transporter protein [Pseudomonadota bacterium]
MRPRARLEALAAIAQVTWKEWAAFRSHMAVSLLTGPLRFVVMSWIWTATTRSSNATQGLARADLIAYSAFALLAGYAVFDFADWNLQMLVRTGRYTNHLLQPLPHPLFAFGQKLGHRALAILLEAVPVWGLVSWWLGHLLVPQHVAWFALSLALGFVLMFLVNYASGLVGFWLVRAEGVRRCTALARDTLAGAWLPLSFFPASFLPLLFLLPYPWILYVPVRIALGSVEILGNVLTAPQAVAAQFAVTLTWTVILTGSQRLANRRFLAAGG